MGWKLKSLLEGGEVGGHRMKTYSEKSKVYRHFRKEREATAPKQVTTAFTVTKMEATANETELQKGK